MVYGFAGLAVVMFVLWRLAVSGRARWRAHADAVTAILGQTRAEVDRLMLAMNDDRVWYERDRARELLEQTEVQLIDARCARDEAWRDRDEARAALEMLRVRVAGEQKADRMAALERRVQAFAQEVCELRQERDQMAERNRDLQERLTAVEARACPCGCAPECVSPRACATARACVDCACSCEGTCARCHPRPLATAPGWDANGAPVEI